MSVFFAFAEALQRAARPTSVSEPAPRRASNPAQEGADAWEKGDQPKDNPYPAGSSEHQAWNDAWEKKDAEFWKKDEESQDAEDEWRGQYPD